MSDFSPTDEQVTILDMFRTGESIAVQALAGTGKTRTLQMLAESCPNRTGVMTAFNKSICVEAAQKMPPSTSVSTMHSIAFRAVGRRYSHRLNSPRMKSMDIARMLRVDPMVIRYGAQSKPMAAGYLAGLVMRSIELFCHSADPEPTERHVPYIDGIDLPASDGKRTYVNNNEVRRAILPAMRRAWADLMNHDGRLPFKHSHYLKSYALSDPKMLGDYLFIDEAGDLSGVMLSIIENQDHMQLVAAGDSRQTINEWLGAIDSLEKFPADRTAALTRSWRFGPAIADVGNGLLDRLGSDLHLIGGAPWASVVAPVVEPDCILTRTNAEAVRTVLDRMDRGQRVYLMGGGSEVVNFAKAARELMEGRWVSHPDLACFSDWGEVVSYTTEDAQGIELRLLVKLVEDYGPEAIVKGLSNATPENQADLTVSTCHRCVHPQTLVETEEGVMPISAAADEGVIATPFGAATFRGKFTRGVSDLVALRTRSGYELAVTADHGLTVWSREQGRHVRLMAGEVAEGDILRLRLGSTIDMESLPPLPHPPARGDIREVMHPIPEWLDHDAAEFLGLMVADGTIFRSGFRVVKRYDSVLDRFSELCRKLFGYDPHPMETEGTAGREVSSTRLVRWLLSIDGLAPNEKAIPPVILKAPLSVQASFLRGLWEDGTVNERDGHIDHVHWENRSSAVAATVQSMLLRQGIISRRTARPSQRGISSVAAFGQNARRFGERIGFIAMEKNARLLGSFSDEKGYVVPLSRAEAEALRPGMSEYQYRNALFRGHLSRHAIELALVAAPDAEVMEKMRWHYEPVVDISTVRAESVCVEVPDGHRFLQNGFDGWNSKGREWGSVQLAGDFFDVREGEDDLNASELKLGYVGVTRAQRELDVTLCPQFLAKPEPKQPPLPAWLQTDDAPVSVPPAPQEPTATHTECPACHRTDVIRGGIVGAHHCAGVRP